MLHSSNTWKAFSNCSDQEVWDQLKEGNKTALEYIYRTYAKGLYNFGMKLYGRDEWVRDGIHDLFVDLWKQHTKLLAVKSLKSYLYKALKYKLQRLYGKEKRWKYKADYDTLVMNGFEDTVENKIISAQLTSEQQLKMARAMEKLPARQREVLHLLYDENMSYEEIAEVMEINVRSVYTLAWKGTSLLRKTCHKLNFFS